MDETYSLSPFRGVLYADYVPIDSTMNLFNRITSPEPTDGLPLGISWKLIYITPNKLSCEHRFWIPKVITLVEQFNA